MNKRTVLPTEDDYRRAAEAAGWRYSPAHGGFVHDDERRGPSEADYIVMISAEEACWLHDIEPEAA